MSTVKNIKKVSRSLKLNEDINIRLVALCEHLGVNPNAYLVGKIGEAISRDEVAFKAQSNVADMMSMFQDPSFLAQLVDSSQD